MEVRNSMQWNVADPELATEIKKLYENNLSCRAIGRELGKPHTTISRYLQAMNLDTSRSEGCKKASDEKYPDIPIGINLMDILEGNLLGDGSITLVQPHQRSAYYQHGTKSKAHLIWLAKILEENGLPMLKIHSKPAFDRMVHGKDRSNLAHFSESFYIKSKSLPSMKKLRERWYSEDKIIPIDLKITPIHLLHWYIGDGSLTIDKIGNRRRIELATQGFPLIYNNFLVRQLQSFNLDAYISKSKSGYGYRIHIGKKDSIELFFTYIGPCPPELQDDYGHKWPN